LSTGGLYQGKNNSSLMEIVRVQVERYTGNDFIEINAISESSDSMKKDKTDILCKLNTDHLNAEEFTALKTLCKKFPKLFHQEGD